MDVAQLHYVLPGETSDRHEQNDLRNIFHFQVLSSDGKVYRMQASGVDPHVLKNVGLKLECFKTLQSKLLPQGCERYQDYHARLIEQIRAFQDLTDVLDPQKKGNSGCYMRFYRSVGFNIVYPTGYPPFDNEHPFDPRTKK